MRLPVAERSHTRRFAKINAAKCTPCGRDQHKRAQPIDHSSRILIFAHRESHLAAELTRG